MTKQTSDFFIVEIVFGEFCYIYILPNILTNAQNMHMPEKCVLNLPEGFTCTPHKAIDWDGENHALH